MTLLHLETEEAMASGADGVAAGAGNLSFVKSGFEDQKCFVQVRAYHLTQTSNYLSIRRLLCILEQESATLLRHLAQGGGCGQ